MKFIITGSLGNISKPLTQLLIEKGHDVTVISNDGQKAGKIETLGARAAIGSVQDANFLKRTFEGADGVYTMVPPNWGVSRYRQYIGEVGNQYLKSISASGVKKVVNLSSIGADLNEGTGSIAGLHDVEDILNTLSGVAVRHLRPGLFFTNFFFDIGTIRKMGIMGGNYGKETKLVMVHPKDIATVAGKELEGSFAGKSHCYVAGEEGQIEDIVRLYVEMGRAIGSGILFEDFETHRPNEWGPAKLADFVPEFTAVYNSGQ
jgi:uncharacterized protein YbjT (DUF2867 family)